MQFNIALAQMKVATGKAKNLATARRMAARAREAGAQVLLLPEMFLCPYDTALFPAYAEEIPGPATEALAAIARDYGLLVVGGSLPEQDGGRLYNTSPVLSPAGKLLARHRKRRLFDIHIPGRQSFRESAVFTPGEEATVFDTDFCRMGLGVCFDLRFPLDAREMAQRGAKVLLYPAAFNTTTGPLHWQLLLRARAVDNLVYTAAAAPARNPRARYRSWGHSLACDPWGAVLCEATSREALLIAPIDLARVDEVRQAFPYHLY